MAEGLAFCKILFARNGGRFTERGLPIFTGELGTCDVAYDCYRCPTMQGWLEQLAQQGWTATWECDACLRATDRNYLSEPRIRSAQGFFAAGRKAQSPESPEFDPDIPPLQGCMRCGWETSYLQLVLWKA